MQILFESTDENVVYPNVYYMYIVHNYFTVQTIIRFQFQTEN